MADQHELRIAYHRSVGYKEGLWTAYQATNDHSLLLQYLDANRACNEAWDKLEATFSYNQEVKS